MADLFRVCVFVPIEGEGDASAGFQAAIQIAAQLGFGVDVHPMSLCPNVDGYGPTSGVWISEDALYITEG